VQIDGAVVPNPANLSARISAPSLKLPGPAKYQVTIGFDFNNTISDQQKKLLFLRAQLYEMSTIRKGWKLIQRFSSSGSIRDKTFTVSKRYSMFGAMDIKNAIEAYITERQAQVSPRMVRTGEKVQEHYQNI
jgi:hypothetical protein